MATVVSASSLSELYEHKEAWDALLFELEEENIFYESWFFIPAFKAFAHDEVTAYFVYDSPNRSKLLGFFPLEKIRPWKKLPLWRVGFWEHLHCFLTTPLIRKGSTAVCSAALVENIKEEGGGFFEYVQLRGFHGSGEFGQTVGKVLEEKGFRSLFVETFNRPLLKSESSFEEYCKKAISSKERKKLRSKSNKLEASGKVSVDLLAPGGNLEEWIAQFLAIEGSGWKTEKGTALSKNEKEREFYLEISREGFKRGKVHMERLCLDEKPIAMKSSFRGRSRLFAFKIGYDETYHAVSPGMLLEYENIRLVHTDPTILEVDSCTATENQMFNSLWMHTYPVATAVFTRSRAVAWLLLLLRKAKRKKSDSPVRE